MYTVYIAEKPDIARAIAAHIWPDATYQKNKYDITNGDTVICWCHGHILRPKEPEEYDTAYKSWSEYQVFPPKWAVVPMANEKDLLTAIASKRLADCYSIISQKSGRRDPRRRPRP